VDVHRPEGAFYLFPDFGAFARGLKERGITSARELCDRLLEDTGVALLPGEDFGRPPRELTARLAYVDFPGGHSLSIAETVPPDRELDEHFLTQYCGTVLEAVDLICNWLE
jgi:aspartate aminotransferase